MVKEVHLLNYWMPILRQLKEFKEIANAEEPELRYILEEADRTLNNMFIETADEYGIKRFENMMGIYPEEGASLETRRFNVLIKWNDKVPYTDKELYNRLLSLCGSSNNFQITERYNEYAIDIVTKLGVAGAFDAVSNLLVDMLPCNIQLNLKNILEAVKTSLLYLGGVTCTAMAYQITHDINHKYLGAGYVYYATGMSRAGTHIITHDIKKTASKETTLNNSVVGVVGSATEITHDVKIGDTLSGNLKGAVGVGVATTRIITHDVDSKASVTGNSTVANPVSNATVITIN